MADPGDSTTSTPLRRTVTALFGVFFVFTAALTLATANTATRIGAIAVAVVLGGLGVDLIVSAIRRTRSLLSRVGPLP